MKVVLKQDVKGQGKKGEIVKKVPQEQLVDELFRLIETLTPPCDITMDEGLITGSHSRWINNGSMAKCQGTFTADMADDILRRKFLVK